MRELVLIIKYVAVMDQIYPGCHPIQKMIRVKPAKGPAGNIKSGRIYHKPDVRIIVKAIYKHILVITKKIMLQYNALPVAELQLTKKLK